MSHLAPSLPSTNLPAVTSQNMKSINAFLTPVVALFASVALTANADIAVKSGEKIGFLGDSITQGGWSNPAGYVRLVIAGLEANGVKAEPVPAGISGHKSNQMLARLEKDVLSKKPQWMTLSCGVNDVWHGPNGVPLNDAAAAAGTFTSRPNEPEKGTYEKNISQIVDAAIAAGARPVILTATVIKEDPSSPENAKLAPYNDFLRKLASSKKLPLADLSALFQERIKQLNAPGKNMLTTDGVHMNTDGNKLMAIGVLKALGLNDSELKKAEASWKTLEEEAAAAAAARKKALEEQAAAKAKAEREAKGTNK
jgi:lysophospholipase L1-like esterase